MPDEDIFEVKELFDAALEHDPIERPAFLAKACAHDPLLRSRVEILLATAANTPEFLDRPNWRQILQPTAPAPSDRPRVEAEAGLPFEKLGDFRLIRRLGEGGMGVVYLAIQESLDRDVALKVIRPDRAGSFEATVRFRREAEAVSKLNHPNIVTVIESGEEQDVRYLAMEWIPGEGLDELLNKSSSQKRTIPTLEVLDWIKQIAKALDYAHQVGIIHRDIKPSNIRIVPGGRAMLMDFGLARLAQWSTLTATGQFRGTPHYSSPEQVDAKGHIIDERTDIYSLGATLYELLTNRVPFKGETTAQVFRQILEKDPLPPRRWNPAISGDLETVVLTALEKEPDRRYQSMQEFADDLNRVLRGEPILAKPAGLVSKIWKRMRRSPAASSAIGVALLAVVALLCSIPWYLIEITDERDKALTAMHESDSQKMLALAAKAEVIEEKKRAVEAKEQAETEERTTRAINDFLQDILASADPGKISKDVTVVEVLDRAVPKLDRNFADQPEIEIALRDTIGKTYLSLGWYDRAQLQFDTALELCKQIHGEDAFETLTVMGNLAGALYHQGKLQQAEKYYREVLAMRSQTLGEDHAETLSSMNNLAGVLWSRGELSAAESLLRKILEIRRRILPEEYTAIATVMNNLASVLWSQARLTEAESLYRETLAIQTSHLDAQHPETLTTMNNLGTLLWKSHRHLDAESILAETVDLRHTVLGEFHPDTLRSMENLANVYLSLGKLSDAESLHQNIYETRKSTLCREHPDILRSMNNLAGTLVRRKKHNAAEPLFREVLEIAGTTLPEDFLESFTWRANYGMCLVSLQRYEEAESHLLKSYLGWKKAWGAERLETRSALNNLIRLYELWGKVEKAAEYRALRSQG